MKTMVVLDESIVRLLLLFCEMAKGAGNPKQEELRAQAERQLRVGLEVLEKARKEAR
jgi:hypothetical protein